jgi:hypothetical protein
MSQRSRSRLIEGVRKSTKVTVRHVVLAAYEPLEQRICLSETVYVPTDGSSATSSMSLDAGKRYELRASGEFYMGVPEDGMADAEYGDFSGPKDTSVSTGVDDGIAVNGAKVRWGRTRPTTCTRSTSTAPAGRSASRTRTTITRTTAAD